MTCSRVLLFGLLLACGGSRTPTTAPEATPALDRLRFNQLALRLNLPLLWETDRDEDGEVDPDEVVTLDFYADRTEWVHDDAFTLAFAEAHQAIRDAARDAAPEDERLRRVYDELGSAAPTLLHTDLAELPAAHRTFAAHMLEVGARIDALYATQVGMDAMASRVAGDTASQAVFRRNWGVRCLSAAFETDAECTAAPGVTEQPVGVYPAAFQATEGFCARLEAAGGELVDPFTVVVDHDGTLAAVPYTTAYAAGMGEVARELRAAAQAIAADPEEAALVAYLNAAATAFETNDWVPADEAWAAMNVRNSAWYVRVAPDEVYWDPCSLKAGFHLTFARIDRDSLIWQDRLAPVRQELETSLAALVPGAYQARDVGFHLPDFIAIVANFGDDRDAFGATIGQSLPNWGPVAEESRGRTVAMTNLYTDSDSLARRREVAASLLSPETFAVFSDDLEPGLVSTILHEAAHNLGPAQEYRVDGRDDTAIFGGGMASMLEELKAQTSALFFLELLQQRQLWDDAKIQQTALDSMVWALGHVSRPMYTPEGNRKAYSQLAAIQVGYLMENGAFRWDANAVAANGTDRGCFTLDFDAFPRVARALMTEVMRIKATGDAEAANALAARYVDGDVVPMAIVVERHRRSPRASFVYAIDR
ncbi:MAG: hypothetical protein H6721_28110 [Sandaracinus sp.]|nr:hypothetical protein [Sandaracinus sp.]